MSATDSANYLRNAVMQATPEQLHLMLYDGAIRFALQGREAIERKDYEAIYDRLSRAQRIVLEMQAGLRPEVNPELCDRMSALYNFIYRKLVSGSVNREAKDIDDAVKILRAERETWALLVDKIAKECTTQGDTEVPETLEAGSLSIEG
jgi:flagellar protein FliS